MRSQPFSVLLIAVAAIAVSWLVTSTDLGQRLEFGIADTGIRFLLRPVESDIVIVSIDAKSLSELKQWPWPRRYHADLIERLAPAIPKHVFVDIDFSSRSNPLDDQLLETALSRWTGEPIILPAFFQQLSLTDIELLVTRPLPAFARNASLASVNLLPGIDGLVRNLAASWNTNGQSLPTVASLLEGSSFPASGIVPIDFSIDPASFDYVSYADVLGNRVAASHFADKTVFVGATAIELGDMVPVPVHQSLPGVVVQALALESIRQGPQQTLPRELAWLLVVAWSLLFSILFHRLTWRQNLATLAAALSLAGGLIVVAFVAFDTLIAFLPFALTAAVSYLLVTLWSLESETLRALAFAVGFRKRDALLKSIVLSTSDCIVCIDGNGIIRTANPAAAGFFAPGSGRLVGKSIHRFIPSLGDNPANDKSRSLDDLSNRIFESVANPDIGESVPVELSISRVRLNDEELYTAIVRDISERKAQQKQLQFQATHDPLTTLPNRPAMAAYLDSALVKRDGEHPFALMMIDLNRFKEVNDTLGHNIGDYVLHEVARRLAEVALDNGFIARIGGDEFALVVDRFSDKKEISSLAEELISCLKSPIETCGVAIDIGVSIGIALFPKDARDAETLFKQSDIAMYVAKRSGSGFEYYEAENDQNSLRRLTIATRLRQAINENHLRLHYQPQINLLTGKVDSAEALLRWNDAELGAVRPDEFIVLAEATDLIQPLTDWTLQESLKQAVQWRERGLDLRLAINISSRILQSINFPARLAEFMEQARISPAMIELEITESAMMIDPKRALRVVDELSKLGVLISIDDYGTGFSSLAYLRDLPVHALKLDKSFVMNMQQHDDDRVIVESTVQMAHALQLKVVAEGVETAADASILREYGYDYAQGFLYSAALQPGAFFDWVMAFNNSARLEQTGRLRSL